MEFAAAVLVGVEDIGQLNCQNGLPVTPSPTRMLSRFWRLHALSHPNLCKYFELMRCQTAVNAVIVVSEHYVHSYLDELYKEKFDECLALKVAEEVCAAIKACHDSRIIVGLVTLENILLHYVNNNPHAKLTQYGLYHISGNNNDVECPIGSVWYHAPERLVATKRKTPLHNTDTYAKGAKNEKDHAVLPATFKSDVWSFGIVLIEMFLRKRLSDIWGVRQISSVLKSVVEKADKESALVPLLDSIRFARPTMKISMPTEIFNVIASCLHILPSRRPTSSELLKAITKILPICDSALAPRADSLNETIEEINERLQKLHKFDVDPYYERPLGERYFLWKLCGSNVENILIRRGVIRMKSPICTVPNLVVDDFQYFGNEDARKVITSYKLCVLPGQNLKERLKLLHSNTYQSIELKKELASRNLKTPRNEAFDWNDISTQTLVVKERDIDYQAFRMRLFAKLLSSYPYSADILRAEARKDIPPHYRAAVWAALLDVDAVEALEEFTRLDTFSDHVSDRQLHVDIPRCHQYDELMTSPAAHYKLKVLLKAWLIALSRNASGYVYWQGLDSLAAPFLVLNFNDIHIAYKCLREFIERYLHNFFLKDNSDTIQEYLSVFMLLVEFIDPDLASHLNELDFPPQLFAIPWFLTCFVHVLPLHKLYHLWDSLLMADASFPLFIGMAILSQLRPQLIKSQFNDAILLFSDLPDLSIDNVVSDSNKYYNSVPASCTHVKHNGARHCVSSLRELLVQLIASSSRIATTTGNNTASR